MGAMKSLDQAQGISRLQSRRVSRFTPTSPEQVAQKLKALLDSGVELENNFVVLGEERIRVTSIRR
jgi:hypothetical protein